ncbi:putative nicotinate-nucleotide pyrophosphorylase NadC [Gottschalkia purinilytica]|uniref:Probable nicotinate-nucleotide pyrophosphorylase [carboxylating] n=1 Tax=Gottschalkia purinilytica TaxID=1503 RepID=A0A0L0W668_GOTPU|nr:carboxylating nicotinate-nucleotide diphosphorylase [Gottschalkia purinilytica]KNF07014.1 putative nicotinate-nucleotide pyrophosphorylase NadC [Gottschalkia purinilytica]
MLDKFLIKKIIENALAEDISGGDITSNYLISEYKKGEGKITVKEDGVISGLDVVEMTFKTIDENLAFKKLKKDGDIVKKGDDVAIIKGTLVNILKGERVALNFLQRMSGIASKSRRYAEKVKDLPVRVVDTRKTTPGLRLIEKYSVKVGGCFNHRYNLSDCVMIKDNHIKSVGGIKEAIKITRENVPHTIKIEVEVESLRELEEALEAKADIIMLDNMNIDCMKKAIEINKGRAILEASGNIKEDNIRQIAELGIDIISVGDLTHSIKSLDISLNII